MSNHLHLVLKTPRPNLATGMRLFLSSYATWWARSGFTASGGFTASDGFTASGPVNGFRGRASMSFAPLSGPLRDVGPGFQFRRNRQPRGLAGQGRDRPLL